MSDTPSAPLPVLTPAEVEHLAEAAARVTLEAEVGQVWDRDQLGVDFEVQGFGAPFVVVRRRSDGVRGSLEFTASPRFYFSFRAAR